MANEAQETISADKLCSLTGLSDRRHRQLAKEGCFPPPHKGQYQLWPTLSGLFGHLRKLAEKTSGTLAEEKQKKLKAERQLKEHELAVREERYVEASEVTREFVRVFTAIKTDIESQELLAPQLAGLPTPEVSKRMRESARETLMHLSQCKWARHLS